MRDRGVDHYPPTRRELGAGRMVGRKNAPVGGQRANGKMAGGVFQGVQALRFLAAILVVVTHATFYVSNRLIPEWNVWEVGTVGVDIFFVISGFVMMVTSTPFVAAPKGWRYFAMRRIVRIVPMYWIATTIKIATLFVLPGVAYRSALEPQHVLFSYLFLPSRNEAGVVEPVLGVGWTLTYEMYFYAIFALALFLRLRPFIFVTSFMLVATACGMLLPESVSSPWAVYLDRVVLFFVVGMAIGKMVQAGYMRWAPLLVAILVTTAVVLALSGHAEWYRSSMFRFTVVCAVVLAVVWAEPYLRGRVPAFVLFLGDASYSIYLFHPLAAPIVPEVMARLGIRVGWLGVVGAIVFALVVSCTIYALIEKRIVKWGRRLPYAGRVPSGSLGATA